MKVIARNKPENISSNICKEAARFSSRCLLDDDTYNKITLTIEFVDPQSQSHCEEFANGVIARCYHTNQARPCYNYKIEIDQNLSQQEMLSTIIHETVHVKQYVLGELDPYHTIGEKKVWRWCDSVFDESADYWTTPWEIEAYEKDTILYGQFEEYLKEHGITI